MTKDQTIKHLKLMQSGARNAIRFSKNDKKISEEERKEDIEIYQDQLEALNIAIKSMDKLEQIEQIVEQYQFYKFDGFLKIKEVLEQE